MSCRITDDENVALYDSVSGWAFGDTFRSREMALDFLDWLEPEDPRSLSLYTLGRKQEAWHNERVKVDDEGNYVLKATD